MRAPTGIRSSVVADVSREASAVEPEPEAAVAVFGDRIDLARRFAADLGAFGEERGLIGPLEPPRLWTRHILNSAVAAPLFGEGWRVGDIGSGAGLPGLVLAIARPDVRWVLIEPMERRVAWLTEQRDALELDNVEIVRARGEDTSLAGEGLADAAPLVRNGGELILLKGGNAENEIGAAEKQIRKFRLTNVHVEPVGEGLIDEPTRVIRATVR